MEVAAYTFMLEEECDGYTLPAFFRRFGRRIKGYVMLHEGGLVFVPHPKEVKFIKPKSAS